MHFSENFFLKLWPFLHCMNVRLTLAFELDWMHVMDFSSEMWVIFDGGMFATWQNWFDEIYRSAHAQPPIRPFTHSLLAFVGMAHVRLFVVLMPVELRASIWRNEPRKKTKTPTETFSWSICSSTEMKWQPGILESCEQLSNGQRENMM